jgi:hypothetical protein
MILLTATRLDVYEQVQFTVEPDEALKAIVTTNPVKVAKVLSQLGVDHPLDLVDFVLEWGVVEIAKPASGKAEE